MPRLIASLALLLAAASAWPQEPTLVLTAEPPDPVLDALIEESLAHRPELAQARAGVEAERERIPQAGALPDPMFGVGIQNDGFRSIQIGKMETSYLSFMLTQPFYFPGKRGLREDVARLGADVASAGLERTRLTVEADVRRAYLELLLARDQLALLGRTEALWEESEKLARTRYVVGEGAQSDLLRAQLERMRLRQQRIALEVTERNRLQDLNRLRGRRLDEPVVTPRLLRDVSDPPVTTLEAALSDAEARSPELAQAAIAQAQAERRVDLAKRERLPDFSLNGGVMARGPIEPMWTLNLTVNLPVWSGRKQDRAVAESAARAEGAARGADAVREVLRLRTEERQVLLVSARDTVRLYRQGLLVQSEAMVNSTLAQYQTGSVPFASVLDGVATWLATQGGYLDALAELQRVAIARREVSLDAPTGASGGMSTGGIPGAGAGMGASRGPAAGAAAAAPEAEGGGAASSGGM